MLTLVPENRTPAGPAALRNEAWSRRDLPAWQKLEQHAAQMRKATLRELFATDPDRASTLAVEGLGMYADFSKNRISAETVELLVKLAEQCGLEEKIAAMFTGEKINVSEDRAVLHTALRAPREATIEVDGQNVVAEVHEVLAQMATTSPGCSAMFCAGSRSSTALPRLNGISWVLRLPRSKRSMTAYSQLI